MAFSVFFNVVETFHLQNMASKKDMKNTIMKVYLAYHLIIMLLIDNYLHLSHLMEVKLIDILVQYRILLGIIECTQLKKQVR